LQTILDRLAGEESFVFLETTRVTRENHRSLLFLNPVDRLVITASDPPSLFFKQAETYLNNGFYLAGWVAYEFGYRLEPVLDRLFTHDSSTVLADFGVFREPRIFDMSDSHNSAYQKIRPDSNSTPGQDLIPESSPGPAHNKYHIENLRLNQKKDDYLKKIQRIKSYITAGDTYQVNYTLKLLFNFFGSPEAFYKTLRRNQNVSYGAYIKSMNRRIMSFSPELFFNRHGSTCTARPMKGTLHRGLTPEEDARLIAMLKNDIKNRSENVMIVDLLRNDLGRLCEMDSVSVKSLFDVETYETLHQMTSTIVGECRPGVSLFEMFSSLFPCGSVTGAPKIRTMEIIRELELE
ncbi:MAG: chorismate-binding protein, partial [Desulfobulbaceae bacterium]|nr:chorismate-binding protein [Desulfobulbaceae bacterium]